MAYLQHSNKEVITLNDSITFDQVLLEIAKHYDADTDAIKKKLYPIVEEILNTTAGKKAYMGCVSNFIKKRYTDLYDNLPCSRIIFTEEDSDDLFNTLGVPKEVVNNYILETYYGNETNFSPKAAKDEFTVLMMCIVRYFLQKNMTKEFELALIHISFSGKFYPSLHYRSYPVTVPVRHVMDYTVNERLNSKFELISQGNVVGAVKKIAQTWASTYKSRFKSFEDEDVVYCIQQLYSRIGSFMKNIATEYYRVYNDKDDLYIAYASDSFDEDNYHMADSDTLRIAKQTEKTVNYLTTNGVNYAICKQCSDENITTKEFNSIMESILSNPKNVLISKEIITLMITTYYQVSKTKDVRDISFLTYTISAKPNTKQKEHLRMRELLEILLSENSPAYVRRKSRIATKNSFERAVKMYFALAIHNANR